MVGLQVVLRCGTLNLTGMHPEFALTLADTLVFATTGQHLNDLQRKILQHVWQGRRYLEIAAQYGYTEGHVKDVASQLWQLLSRALNERVTKRNCWSVLERHQPSPIPLGERSAASIFVGRTAAIDDLNQFFHQGHRGIVIQGEGGVGKTTLAQHYLQNQAVDQVLELLMAKETSQITPVERVVEEWLWQDLGIEPGREFGVTLSRLKRVLHTRRIGILIDNVEPALDQQGRFVAAHAGYGELLRVLTDNRVQSITLLTSRDRICEPGVSLLHYRLQGLTLGAWRKFFHQCGVEGHEPTLVAMHQAYAGNAKAMELLWGAMQADFEGDMVAYWQENRDDPLAVTDLKNLVQSQVERLQRLDSDAYRVYCRLGCYRYQDVPKLPKAGLVQLMWDIAPERHQPIITSLRNRSLLEGQKGFYWLHPVIRADAIARLRPSPDWVTTHRQAATFWTESITTITTLADAIQALEAYYHYLEICDLEAAGRVILKSRNNQWQQFLPLGSTLYRMGLIQPVITAIQTILDGVQTDQSASELRNILGDLYWITGDIRQAITCQEQAIAIATQRLQSSTQPPVSRHTRYCLKMLEVDSLLSLGLYHLDLWELERSAELFEQVIVAAEGTDHHRWAEKAFVCLGLTYSWLGRKPEAAVLAERMFAAVLQDQRPEYRGRFAYFIQLLGQTFSNLSDVPGDPYGHRSRAADLYHRAIRFAEQSHYIQVKARALSGLGELDRQQGQWAIALGHHHQAIDLLQDIGAQCDLAEAYYQAGLTYVAMGDNCGAGETRPSQHRRYFETALGLFERIQAPKQVLKVKNQLSDSQPVRH